MKPDENLQPRTSGPSPDSFAARLRDARLLSGIDTQSELARRSGVLQQTISEWEKGAVATTMDSLRRICVALRIPPSHLLGMPPQVGDLPADAWLVDMDEVEKILANLSKKGSPWAVRIPPNCRVMDESQMREFEGKMVRPRTTTAYSSWFGALRRWLLRRRDSGDGGS